MKSFRQPVHQLHNLLRGQVPGLFDNLIQRHRYVLKLPTTQPQLKSEARVLLFGVMARRQAVGRACGAGRFTT
jgi:hypothetical protein